MRVAGSGYLSLKDLAALLAVHADQISPNTYCAGCSSATRHCPRCQRHWCPGCGEKKPCNTRSPA